MKNKQLAMEQLANDCEVRERYYIPGEGTCAVGKLAQLSGVPNEKLIEAGATFICELHDILTAIHNKFGLESDQLQTIQSLNDEADTIEDRRREVLNYINSIPETTET